jgi:magnesium-transporting ATPase (P-type)
MNVWMLTGDNGITAKEIGISSGILDTSQLIDGKSKNLIEIDEDIDEAKLIKECE